MQQPVAAELEPAPQRTQRVISGDGFGDPADHPELQVILEILANCGPIQYDRDAMTLQLCGGADSRQHQKLRRLDGAGSENHAALGGHGAGHAAAAAGHADCALSGEQNFADLGVGENGQIAAVWRRVADRHRPMNCASRCAWSIGNSRRPLVRAR